LIFNNVLGIKKQTNINSNENVNCLHKLFANSRNNPHRQTDG